MPSFRNTLCAQCAIDLYDEPCSCILCLMTSRVSPPRCLGVFAALPSNGFINASLAIVAEAPLTAAAQLAAHHFGARTCHTGCKRMMVMLPSLISTHGVLYGLVRRKVDRVSRTCSFN